MEEPKIGTLKDLIQQSEKALLGLAEVLRLTADRLEESVSEDSNAEKVALNLTVMPAVGEFLSSIQETAPMASMIGGIIELADKDVEESTEFMKSFYKDLSNLQKGGSDGRED